MFSLNLTMYVHIISLLFLMSLRVSETATADSDALHRSRRQLIFPNSTVLQFNIGIGTPTLAEKVNLNWAFQANFQLPWNRSQIPVDILNAGAVYDGDSRGKRDVYYNGNEIEGDSYENDAKLYHFYKYIEDALTGFGYNGTSCVLQALCQIGGEPLHTHDEEDLLHEIATYVLNPTHDAVRGLTEKDDAYPYVTAYQRGHEGKYCIQIYNGCTTSLIDMFTKLHDVP